MKISSHGWPDIKHLSDPARHFLYSLVLDVGVDTKSEHLAALYGCVDYYL